MSIQVISASAVQAALVHSIMQAAFAQYTPDDQLPFAAHAEGVEDTRRAMAAGGAVLAWLDGEAVGSARYRLEPGVFTIERVAVLPTHQGCGIASAMLNSLEATAASFGYAATTLCSRLSLSRNVALYQHRGYEIATVDEASGRVRFIKPLLMTHAEPA